MKTRCFKFAAAITAATLLIAGCATDEYGQRRPLTETEKGVGIGAVAGAAIGAAVTDKHGKGAALGAVGGALVGGLVGNYMEKQRRDFERVLAPEIAAGVIRVEKLSESELLVGMTGETAFEVDSDRIKPGFFSTMDKIASVVNKYGKTELDIAGHTDSTGSSEYNQQLSERRAQSVKSYLLGQNVYPPRLSAVGFGKNYPIAGNETEDGRRRNRRVDITIVAVTEKT
jgi:outer membrane protein OmpA-like peptidoglycan-associated protein